MAGAIAVGFVLTACAALFAQGPRPAPRLDTTRHSVPLEDIYFDTFGRTDRPVRLPDATPALIEQLRDAIPPLHRPRYEAAREVEWLRDDDLVVGYAAGSSTWAYPIRILNFHEIVNDVLDGVPVLVSYCPLCHSGVVFGRILEGRTLTFGNTSALYESDMVMLDYQTGSYWWQVAGRAIVGPLTGKQLPILPSTTTTWRVWNNTHPGTAVLSRVTGYQRNYNQNPFAGYAAQVNRGGFAFPVTRQRYAPLDPGTIVLAVRRGGAARAYPIQTGRPLVIQDRVADEPTVVFMDGHGGAAAFDPRADGRELTFHVQNGAIRDKETGTHWDVAGQAVAGTLVGRRLQQLPARTSFWFAVVASDSDLTVHRN